MFINAGTDIMYRFSDKLSNIGLPSIDEKEITELSDILNEFKRIVEYGNECFTEIEKTYHCKTQHFFSRVWDANYVYQ